MKIIRCEQGSEEWNKHRAEIITCSELGTVMASGKTKGSESVTRRKYMLRMAGERLTGEPADSWNGNAHTEHGKIVEPMAVEAYEDATFCTVDRGVGIILNHGIGYSPDGLVDDIGAIECKRKIVEMHLELFLSGTSVPANHVKQCQGGLWVSEREWIDFISFWPKLPPYIVRAYRNEKLILEIKEACEKFYDELENVLTEIRQKASLGY